MVDLISTQIQFTLLSSRVHGHKTSTLTCTFNPNEVSGTGYTAGGQALAGKAVTADNTDNEGYSTQMTLCGPPRPSQLAGGPIQETGGGSQTDPELIWYIDFGTDKISTAGSFTITWNAEESSI